MTLWSIQPLHLYEKLLEHNVLHCDPEQDGFWIDFRDAYDWLVEQMVARIGLPPKGVQYPFWAWALVDGVSKKPDLRRGIFNNYAGENVVLELEIPNCDVLLSDECNWHYVLNNWYLHDVNDAEGKWDETDAWFDSLPPDEQDTIRKTSWERIFDKDDPDNDWDFVQATFWELKVAQVKNVRRFIGRQKPKSPTA